MDTKPDPPARVALQRWEDAIPWFLTAASTVALAVIAWFLVENVLWFRHSALGDASVAEAAYRVHMYHLHVAMIKRSVGLFSGFALLFLGSAVVFYTLKTTSRVSIEGAGLTARALSASPGLIGMALGVVLLLGTITSKDDFPPYAATLSSSTTADSMVVIPFTPE